MTMTRRAFIGATLLLPAVARSQARTPPTVLKRPFARVVCLADGVCVTLANPSGGPQCASNGGVLYGRDGVLLVEGHLQRAGAALELEAAGLVSRTTIRGAVDTHFHLDHTFGNAEYAAHGAPILAHERVPDLMKRQYAALRGSDKSQLLEPYERRAREARTDAARKRTAADLDAMKWMFSAVDTVDLAYPTELVRSTERARAVDLGGLTLSLRPFHGHTPGDLVVHLPSHDLAFVGDLVFHHEYPVAIDADMVAWRDALNDLTALGRDTRFVPGHGPILGVGDVHAFGDLLDDLRAHAEKMIRAGAAADEAADRYVVPPRWREYEIFSWDWTIGAAMRSYFARLA